MLTNCATHKEVPEIPVASKTNEYGCEAGDILTIGKVIVRTEPEQAVLRAVKNIPYSGCVPLQGLNTLIKK